MERRRSPSTSSTEATALQPEQPTAIERRPLANGNGPSLPDSPAPRAKRGVPEGLWLKCGGCGATIYRKEAEDLLNVCPQCGYHWYVSAAQRIEQLLDAGTFEEWDATLRPTDPLGFKDKKPYADRIVAEQRRTGLSDAALTGTGMIRARRVAIGVTDSAFIMGSMGSVVGERLARLVERATAGRLPLIIISASGGGARMHEGILSLMQMAKVSAALARYSCGGQLRLARRPLLRRAPSADRIRRSANDQGHHPGRAAGRLSDERVSPGARLRRSDRVSQGSQERDRPGDRLLRLMSVAALKTGKAAVDDRLAAGGNALERGR